MYTLSLSLSLSFSRIAFAAECFIITITTQVNISSLKRQYRKMEIYKNFARTARQTVKKENIILFRVF